MCLTTIDPSSIAKSTPIAYHTIRLTEAVFFSAISGPVVVLFDVSAASHHLSAPCSILGTRFSSDRSMGLLQNVNFVFTEAYTVLNVRTFNQH